jgi:hypothetical protein
MILGPVQLLARQLQVSNTANLGHINLQFLSYSCRSRAMNMDCVLLVELYATSGPSISPPFIHGDRSNLLATVAVSRGSCHTFLGPAQRFRKKTRSTMSRK